MFTRGSKSRAILGSILFFFVAPFVVAGVLPFLLFGWSIKQPFFGLFDTTIVGIAAILIGLGCLLECFSRFALEGRGTPAPVAQTEILVASGLYRFVRNPMYVAVLTIVLGEGLLFSNGLLFAYGVSLWMVFHLFIRFYEEPQLEKRFGNSYDTYRKHVRRWWPRLSPWNESRPPIG
ncbi:MAG: isoprenylcysteine carboxylmethyltransferase family protein [Gammaproteobacteria bacterium]|nr:isoprenylcysteine carboxylmethyltransferase family protein [Gammaproteobacteria bacterium]